MDEQPITEINGQLVVDGKKWIAGWGKTPAEFMFIGDKPDGAENSSNKVFNGPAARILFEQCRACGFDIGNSYFTNAVKYAIMSADNKGGTPSAGDIKACRPILQKEVTTSEAKIIVCLGAVALKTLVGNKYKFSEYRGILVDHPDIPGVKIFPMFSPGYILRNPEVLSTFTRDLQILAAMQRKETITVDKTQFMELKSVAQLKAFIDAMFTTYPRPVLAIDAEWNGVTWMDKDRYIRTVQLAYAVGQAVVIVFTEVGGVQVMDNPTEAWAVLKAFLEDPRVDLIGHNIISDGEWLASYGVDLRKRTVFDTMLAEHTFNESGPFGLEELTAKYTNLGPYHVEVMQWHKDHKAECTHGFGAIPSWLLHPYGATDADATLRAALAQGDKIAEAMLPRGQYPSLWKTVMETQKAIYELEQTGILVDQERLKDLTIKYKERMTTLESLLKTMAVQLGMTDFNHRATADVRALLFEYAKLQPVTDTKGKKWNDENVGGLHLGALVKRTPSTDKTTKEILQEKHPIAKMLLNVSRLDTVLKFLLREEEEDEDESSKGGGIIAKIWPDGRLHPHFSQLSDTGRFRHSKPNVANWPKKGEGYMEDIFGGKAKVPPLVRTIVIPTPGYVIMEGDFVQAELFVLAALSGDTTMMGALTTPGKDLHDLTAIDSFKLTVLGPDGTPAAEQLLVDMAKRDMKAFKEYQTKLQYRTLQGKVLSRSEFRSGLRISAKNLNFGIPLKPWRN